MSYTFHKSRNPKNLYEVCDITITVDDDTRLLKLCNAFHTFIKSCGYHCEDIVLVTRNPLGEIEERSSVHGLDELIREEDN